MDIQKKDKVSVEALIAKAKEVGLYGKKDLELFDLAFNGCALCCSSGGGGQNNNIEP